MKAVLRNLLPLAVMGLLASCEHKELCYDHAHTTAIDVVFDWNYAPDAEADNAVEGMCLWFYPVDGDGNGTGKPIYVGLTGMKGGRVNIPKGRYHVLYYNNDFDRVLFRGTEEFFTHECYTRAASPEEAVIGVRSSTSILRAGETGSEPVVLDPQMMWGDNAMDVEITDSGITYRFTRDGETEETVISNAEKLFTLMPHEQVCTYHVTITGVENLGQYTGVSLSLSGMSGSVFCAEERLSDSNVTLTPVEAVSDRVSVITGELHAFGHHGSNDERHILTVYATAPDGSVHSGTADVTGQIDSAPDRRHVEIKVDGFKLPQVVISGGLTPDVSEWEQEDETIEM